MTICNFNVGILGHVDSGKTSLARALSTTASTAAFDKNPQSQERGITLDLGFSSFQVDTPPQMGQKCDKLQYTLVDCPGHASLIRTIIGGAQIIDLMILVIDITKGMQTQTAECLVIGEITCSAMIVVLNKIDAIPEPSRDTAIQKMTKKMKATLSKTKFKDAPIVAVTAKPPDESCKHTGINELIDKLKAMTFVPDRSKEGPCLFAVDHCFSIRGQGTVMTGTVLQGAVSVNDSLEIASLKEVRKVKSIQIFKKSVDKACQGDRAGVCVTQFDAGLLERGLVSSPGYLPTAFAILMPISKIRFFKGEVSTGTKFHVSIGHATVLASLTLFSCDESLDTSKGNVFQNEYEFQQTLQNKQDCDDDEEEEEKKRNAQKHLALLEFEKPVVVAPNSLVLGSKLDTDVHTSSCRLAFEGHVLHHYTNESYRTTELPRLKIFKLKEKRGVVERANNESELIGKGMFKKETNIHLFDGFKVTFSTGGQGVLDGPFGQSGKFKIRCTGDLPDSTKSLLSTKKGKKSDPSGDSSSSIIVFMRFKKYIFDKHMAQ